MPRAESPQDPAPVDFAEFAHEFVRRAVTEQRVGDALGSLASKELRLGPYSATGLARLTASGRLGTPRVRGLGRSFAVTVPATLDLVVKVGAESRLQADVEIDLVLTPRPAHPLLLVIDAATVDTHDVRIQTRGRGLGAAVSGILGGVPTVITDEVRRQVAKQVSGLLRGPKLRRARTIDIAARIDGVRSDRPDAPWQLLDDEEFGRRFVAHAVSEGRVRAAFGGFAGQPIEIEPMKVGPGGLAEVRVTGAVGEAVVRPAEAAGSYDITLPVELDVVVDLAREHQYHVQVTVPLTATPRPAEKLQLVIEIPPVADEQVTVVLRSADRLAGMLGRAGKIEEQIAHQVATTVNRRIAAARGRVVDIAAIVEGDGSATDRAGDARPRPGRAGAQG